MANSIETYTDTQLMTALLTRDFSTINREFIDDVITSIKVGAFYQAQNLDKVSLTAATVIKLNAFMETSLSTLELTWSALTSIGQQAFYKGWHALPQTLSLPNVTELGAGAFGGTSSAKNTKLVSVSLPSWTGAVPSSSGLPGSTYGQFEYCSKLASVNLPELTSLPTACFRGCTSLQEIVLPKVNRFASNNFLGCSNLKKIDIGGAVTSMTALFLPASSNLDVLILRGVTTVPTLGATVFNGTDIEYEYCYIYVPKSLEAAFKVATNWSTYAGQIRAIEDYPDVCGS